MLLSLPISFVGGTTPKSASGLSTRYFTFTAESESIGVPTFRGRNFSPRESLIETESLTKLIEAPCFPSKNDGCIVPSKLEKTAIANSPY